MGGGAVGRQGGWVAAAVDAKVMQAGATGDMLQTPVKGMKRWRRPLQWRK